MDDYPPRTNGNWNNQNYDDNNGPSQQMRSRRYSREEDDEFESYTDTGVGHTAPFYMTNHKAPTSLRGDGYGGGGFLKYSPLAGVKDNGIQSHNYEADESEVWRAYVAQVS